MSALPSSDVELWLILAAGVVSPAGEAVRPIGDGPPELPGTAGAPGRATDEFDDDEADEVSRVIGALCALEHVDWLAAVCALAQGGPGTPASATAMARYVREYCETEPRTGPQALREVPDVPDVPDTPDVPADLGDPGDEDFDEQAVAELFSHVASLWEVLGATDAEQRLTSLGWWGLPEAMRKVWAPST